MEVLDYKVKLLARVAKGACSERLEKNFGMALAVCDDKPVSVNI